MGEKVSAHCLRPHSFGLLRPIVFLDSGLPQRVACSDSFSSDISNAFSKTGGSWLAQPHDSLRVAPRVAWG